MNEDHVYESMEDAPTATDDAAAPAPTEEREPLPDAAQTDPQEPDTACELPDDPGADPDPSPDPTVPPGAGNGIDELRDELNRLKTAFAAREQRRERIEREYGEFRALYPNVPLEALSDALWSEVEHGTPLAAAFALEERRRIRREEMAESENRKNKERSSGALHVAAEDELSPAEVRAMSAADVRRNLSRIMRSMQKWR